MPCINHSCRGTISHLTEVLSPLCSIILPLYHYSLLRNKYPMICPIKCHCHLVIWHSHGRSPCLIGKPSISMGHLYHGYVSHNHRVNRISRWFFLWFTNLKITEIRPWLGMIPHTIPSFQWRITMRSWSSASRLIDSTFSHSFAHISPPCFLVDIPCSMVIYPIKYPNHIPFITSLFLLVKLC